MMTVQLVGIKIVFQFNSDLPARFSIDRFGFAREVNSDESHRDFRLKVESNAHLLLASAQ
jgi:hypothetical protein